jgi:hypothetical protein
MSQAFLVSCLLFLCPGAADRAHDCLRINCWPAGGDPQALKVLRGCELVLIRVNSAPGCRGLDGVPLGEALPQATTVPSQQTTPAAARHKLRSEPGRPLSRRGARISEVSLKPQGLRGSTLKYRPTPRAGR